MSLRSIAINGRRCPPVVRRAYQKIMSSFIGHSIIGLSVSRLSKKSNSWKWSVWLMFLAFSPDINYIALWILGSQTILKHSHSIGFVLILPILSVLFLKYKKNRNLLNKSFQLFTASFSHLFLDLLVGVFPKAYLWPFYSGKLTLPFGVLPSAGKLDWQNYYLYRNLLIELGILLPFIAIIYLCLKRRETEYFLIKQFLLISMWIPFLIWGISLYRG